MTYEPFEWGEAEWDEGAQACYWRGLALEAHADGYWAVKATAAVSEWPELYDGRQARAGTMVAAKMGAEKAAARATKGYGEPATREERYG